MASSFVTAQLVFYGKGRPRAIVTTAIGSLHQLGKLQSCLKSRQRWQQLTTHHDA